MEKYSLWFTPTGEVHDRLSQIVHRLSVRCGAPEFQPHVTLLGSIPGRHHEMVEQTARVAEAIRPFNIRLGSIDFLEEYFRCLFVRTPLTQPLRRAYRAACRELDRHRKKTYMPHLSLLYGNFAPALKQEIIAEIGPRLDVQFRVRSVDLYRTHGEPRNWRRVASFNLS